MVNRQQATTAVFALAGAGLLGFSLRLEPGSQWFYPATFGLAAVWATGAIAAGPLHLGREGREPGGPRPVIGPVLLGLGLAGVFVVGGLIVREVEFLERAVSSVLAYAIAGSGVLVLVVTVVNGLAEEAFFRGALYDAVPRHKVMVTALIYAVVTLLTGNVMLAFAALLLGLVLGRQRQATGGILAPMLTHITWSVTMLYALPVIFG